MRINRRRLLWAGGGIAALLPLARNAPANGDTVEIVMAGRANGAHVWFDPIGLSIEPGQTVRWTNRDEGNAHTATAYHPDNHDRMRRIPKSARSWDSDYLLPGESFSVTLTVPGIYDYYCIPHEHAGMVGRIVVGRPVGGAWIDEYPAGELPEIALANLPAPAAILAEGAVRSEGRTGWKKDPSP